MTGVTTNAATTFKLALNSSDTRALDSIQLRAGDRKQSTFAQGHGIDHHITYTADRAEPVGLCELGYDPQIQYEDLGLTLARRPRSQRSGLVRMDSGPEIEALAGSAINDIPNRHPAVQVERDCARRQTTLIAIR